MNRTLKALLAAALVLGAGQALLAAAPERETLASLLDAEAAKARFAADVPIGNMCVFWANATTGANQMRLRGGSHTYDGCVHSNGDVDLTGRKQTFHRTLRYVAKFKNNSNEHELRAGVVRVTPQPLPVQLDLARYAPGGAAANAASAAGRYYFYTGNVALNSTQLHDGLHYVQGTLSVDATASHNVTLVSTSTLTVTTAKAKLAPYIDGLLVYSHGQATTALGFTGEASTLAGVFFAPRGGIAFASNGNTYRGQVVAHTIDVSGQLSHFRGASAKSLASPPPPFVAAASAASPVALPFAPPPPSAPADALTDAAQLAPGYVGIGDFDENGRGGDVALGAAGHQAVIALPDFARLLP